METIRYETLVEFRSKYLDWNNSEGNLWKNPKINSWLNSGKNFSRVLGQIPPNFSPSNSSRNDCICSSRKFFRTFSWFLRVSSKDFSQHSYEDSSRRFFKIFFWVCTAISVRLFIMKILLRFIRDPPENLLWIPSEGLEFFFFLRMLLENIRKITPGILLGFLFGNRHVIYPGIFFKISLDVLLILFQKHLLEFFKDSSGVLKGFLRNSSYDLFRIFS